ncbi:hypothetical protein ACWC9T_17185 [Kitasatospora sp. NPDC001159]
MATDDADSTAPGVQATTWFTPQRHGGDTLIIEVPAWASHPDPTRPAHDPRTHLTACADQLRHRGQLLTNLLDTAQPHLDDTPLLRAAHTPLTALRQLADEWDPQIAGERLFQPGLMTQARLEGIDLWAHRLPVRTAALLRRAIGATHDHASPSGERLDHLLQDWCAQYQERFQPTSRREGFKAALPTHAQWPRRDGDVRARIPSTGRGGAVVPIGTARVSRVRQG